MTSTYYIAPCLKSFDFAKGSVFLINSPLLPKLSLVNTDFSMGHGKYGLAKFFESFPALKASPLGLLCGVQSLVAGEVPKELPSALTRLYLSDVCVDEGWTLCALCLIRSSPYLQEIEVQVVDKENSSVSYGHTSRGCCRSAFAKEKLEKKRLASLHHLGD